MLVIVVVAGCFNAAVPVFSEKRIRASLEKLVKSRQTSAQGRLDGFFKVVEKRPVITPVNE